MKTEDKITAAFDAAEPAELDELLGGIETETDAFRARRIKRATLFKSGLAEPGRGKALTQRTKRFIAAAAALVFVFGAVFGATAYANEVKEYNEAMTFFSENELPTEGLSRSEIKEAYRSIVAERLSGGETDEVFEVGKYTFDLSGIEFAEHPASDTDYSTLWKKHGFGSVPESDDEYAVETYGGLLALYDDGVHYINSKDFGDGHDNVGAAVLERYKRNELQWRYSVAASTFDAFEVFDDCVIAVGRRGNNDDRGVSAIAKFDEKTDGFYSIGNLLVSRRTFSILEDDEGNYMLFTVESGDAGYRICMLRFSKYYVKLISETAIDCPAGYYPVRAARLGTGYALLLQATTWNWIESNGDMARQMIAFIDADEKLTSSAPVMLDTVASEVLEARDTDDGCVSMLSLDLEDSCFVIADMQEYRGKLYFSGYALPRGGYSQSDEPNPSSHHDEILPLILEAHGKDLSEEEFTALLRANYTALLLEYDPAGGAPTAFCLEAGALGNSLRVDGDGRLVWNVCSIQRGLFSPATSAFSALAYTAVYEYRFTSSGAVIAADTGARTTLMR